MGVRGWDGGEGGDLGAGTSGGGAGRGATGSDGLTGAGGAGGGGLGCLSKRTLVGPAAYQDVFFPCYSLNFVVIIETPCSVSPESCRFAN